MGKWAEKPAILTLPTDTVCPLLFLKVASKIAKNDQTLLSQRFPAAHFFVQKWPKTRFSPTKSHFFRSKFSSFPHKKRKVYVFFWPFWPLFVHFAHFYFQKWPVNCGGFLPIFPHTFYNFWPKISKFLTLLFLLLLSKCVIFCPEVTEEKKLLATKICTYTCFLPNVHTIISTFSI